MTKKTLVSLVSVFVLLGVGWLAGFVIANMTSNQGSGLLGETESENVVATVNGAVVTEFELQVGLASGFDRAVVIDRYVNKVLSAQLGEKRYPELATEAKRAASREVLSTLYTTRQIQEIKEKITDEEIKAYYDENIQPENFRQWRVKYYLSTDRQDVVNTLEKMKKGDKEALKQLELLTPNDQDGFAGLQAIPYGLGRVVGNLKKGEFTESLSLRNGFMFLQLDDSRQLDIPEVAELREQIMNIMATQTLNADLLEARRKAEIQLK